MAFAAHAFRLSGALLFLPMLAVAQGSRPKQDVHKGPIDLPEVVGRSAQIVHGAVASSRVDWVDRSVYTFYTLTVNETLKGPTRRSLIIAVPGGAIGNIQMAWSGVPRLQVGDEVVFFGNPFRGGPSFESVGWVDGLVQVRPDPQTGTPSVSARGQQESRDRFLAEVRSLSRP
jgi:hypothetical protein